MIAQFFKDGAIYSLGNIFNKVMQILMIPFFARVLSTEDFGMVEMVTVATTVVNCSIALEIHQAISRFIPSASEEKRRIYMSTALVFSIVVYAIFVFIALAFWKDISQMLFSRQVSYSLFLVIIASVVSTYLFSFLNNQLRWLLMAKQNVMCNLLSSAANIVFSSILILYFQVGVVGILLGTIVGNISAAILSAFYGRNYISLVFDYSAFCDMISFSYPTSISSVGVILGNFIDRIFIKNYMTLGALGIYAMGYKIAGVCSILISGIQGGLMPLIYRHYESETMKKDIDIIFRVVILVFLLLFLTVGFFSKEIVAIFLGAAFSDAAAITPLLALATIMSSLYVFAPGIHIAKKSKMIAGINITVAIINIIINYVMIPTWGITGAAVAGLIRAFLFCTLFFYISNYFYSVPYKWSRIFNGLGFSLLMYCIVEYFFKTVNITFVFIKINLLLLVLWILIILLIEKKERDYLYKAAMKKYNNYLNSI